jgi:hypothetical protein
MPTISLNIAGLSLLVASKNASQTQGNVHLSGEIAMLNPDRAHVLPSDLSICIDHPPLLIVEEKSVVSFDRLPPPINLDGAIRAAWIEPNRRDLRGLVGWSVQGSLIEPDVKGEAAFTLGEGEVHLTEQGCRDRTKLPDTEWSSPNWVAQIQRLYPGLKLAPEWRDSPHVAARLQLRGGVLSGGRPVEVNAGKHRMTFRGQAPRVFTDSYHYQTPNVSNPALLLQRPDFRWRLPLKATDEAPIRAWLLSLDDQRVGSPPAMDHWAVYSFLPWRFATPRLDGVCGAADTDSACINAAFIPDED